MDRIVNKIKLFTNNNEKSMKIAKKVIKQLKNSNFEIVDDNYDLGIAIGGDGSFLRMVKNNHFNSDIYYIGINAGTLGFLQEVRPEDSLNFVEKLNINDFKIDEIGIQQTSVSTTESTSNFYSLNEIVIREKDLNTADLTIKIDDVELEKFVGDGILIATSVGSTAYNLSFGGSIVYNTLHTLQITPIAPLNSKAYRDLLNSIIIPETKVISLIPSKERSNLLISVDGENNVYDGVICIKTLVDGKRIKCLRMANYDFSRIVNEKFLKD